MVPQQTQKEYKKLLKTVKKYRSDFHSGKEEISQEALDSLKKRLADMEKKYPSLKGKDSPTETIESGKVLEKFEKIKHKVRQWSFNDIFTKEEWENFDKNIKKVFPSAEYFCEYKIDGVKVVIEYKNGELFSAATRGDGVVGENITEHIKTIKDVPKTIPTKDNIIVEGEVWLSKKEFLRINKEEDGKYANPRNLTAGTLRQLDISVVESRKLNIFFYDMPVSSEKIKTQEDEFKAMKRLGLKVNPKTKLFKNADDVVKFWESLIPHRNDEEFCVDGIVVKVNDRATQEKLGYTGKAPRFAIAFKFPAEEATSKIEEIAFQVGRTGVITPVAHLTPVVIDGSLVSRATLHNEDNIKNLDIRMGDNVILRKAGDIIPEIVKVLKELRTGKEKKFIWPKKISACGGDGSIMREEGKSAWKCATKDSFAQRLRIISHFASKQALDIEGFAEKLVEQLLDSGLISNSADIFTLKKGDLLELPLIKEKKADNILSGIEKARNTTFPRLLVGLSIDGVGQEVAYSLARSFSDIRELQSASAEKIEEISNIGEERVESIKRWFNEKENEKLLEQLLKHLTISNENKADLIGKSYVITGSFDNLSRNEIEQALRNRGATVSGSVSQNTNIVFVGDKPGDKLEQAKKLNIKVAYKDELLKLLKK